MSLLWIKAVANATEEYPYGPKGPKIFTPEELEQQKAAKKPLQDRLWGSNDLNKLFGGAPQTIVPFPRSNDMRHQRDPYDPDLLRQSHLEWRDMSPEERTKSLKPVDPRELYARQQWVTRGHMEYYMNDEDKTSGQTSADRGNIGNQAPVIYKREDGQSVILSGTHRATRALLRGEPLMARVIEGPWGPERK